MSQLSFDTITPPADEGPRIDGLELTTDLVDSTTELALLAAIAAGYWMNDLTRRVQHYGYRYDYQLRSSDPSLYLGSLPAFLDPVVAEIAPAFAGRPDQAIVNEYMPGQGIARHIDCLPCFGPTVATLSLAAPIVMEFEDPLTGQVATLDLPPRSLLTIRGPARSRWKHGIAKRKSDLINGVRRPRMRRVSITLRTMELGPTANEV